MSFTNVATYLETSTPSTPGANKWIIYPKSDGYFYALDDAGVEHQFSFTGGSSGSDVTLTPASSTRNVIQPTGDFIGLVLKNNAGQTVSIFETQSSAGAVLASLSAAGGLTVTGLREVIGGFAGIFTHANSADRTYTFPNFDGTVSTLAGAETLSNKTLTTPAIDLIKPSADGTIAFQITKADGTTQFIVGDTTNKRLYVNGTSTFTSMVAGTVSVRTSERGFSAETTGTFGDTSNQAFFARNADNSVDVFFSPRASDLTFGTTKNIPMYITNNSAVQMSIRSGKVGIGVLSSGTRLSVVETDSATNTVTNVVTIGHNGGTVTSGFGAGLLWVLESSTTDNRSAALMEVLWNDATDAAALADLVLSAYKNAGGSLTKREGVRIRGGSSATQIGLFGATPVAQSTGWAVTNPSTRKTFDTTTVTLPQLAEVVGTMIDYLISFGPLSA